MPVVHREIVLPVPRERAWELLTDPAELAHWLADEVELEPEPGALVRVADAGGEHREGVVEEVEPGERIAFTWGEGADASRVEWRLEPAPAGTRVLVSERSLLPVPAAAWQPRLDALARAAVVCLA